MHLIALIDKFLASHRFEIGVVLISLDFWHQAKMIDTMGIFVRIFIPKSEANET